MSLFLKRNEGRAQRGTHRDNETFLNSLLKKTQLNITNKYIQRWIVRGEYLYFKDDYFVKKIVVYSIPQRRVEREIQHENFVRDFTFVGDRFLVSVGYDFVRVWNASGGALLASKGYEYEDGYVTCIAVSPTTGSFLYITKHTIRRLDIATLNSTAVQLDEVNTTTFDERYIWPSEVCDGRIALVLEIKRKLQMLDVTTFNVTAQLDLSPHLTGGIELNYNRNFDVSFQDRVVFCVGDSVHSLLKILILNPANLDVRKLFIIQSPIYCTLEQHSKLSYAFLWIGANASDIRMQYFCAYYYQIIDISSDEEKLTSSYGFHIGTDIKPNCKSLGNGVIESDEDGKLILRHAGNKIKSSSNDIYGLIEKLYQECTRSEERAVHFCEQLSPTFFNGSLLELYCAHRLLMMALQDGDVQKSLHHNDVKFKWHKTIYAESRNVKIESAEDEKELTLILMEAAKSNVIESVSQYLLAHQILEELQEQDRKIFNLERHLFVRLVQLETAHMKLETEHQNLQEDHQNLELAFKRYRKVQSMTQLMGIALNVIPFLGSSVTAAFTASAEIVDSLQISDVADGSIQVSLDVISASPTFEKGFLSYVNSSLRREEIQNRFELLRTLDKCGVTIDELQTMLNYGIQGNEGEEEQKNEEPNPIQTPVENVGGSSAGESSQVDKENTMEVPSVEDRLSSTEEHHREYEIASKEAGISNQTSDHPNPKMDLSNLEKWKISEFEKLSKNREVIRPLKARQCSYFVAALMVYFDDDFEDEFRKLQPLLFRISKSRMILGKVLCNYKKYSKVVDGMLDDLQKSEDVNDVMIGELMEFINDNKFAT